MKIIFEDQDLVVTVKPSGWLSVPSSKGKSDHRKVVGIELQTQLGITLFPLHRLDLEVEGLLAFAKNAKAQARIQKLWQDGKVQKIYRALSSAQNFSHWPENVNGKVEESPQKSPWKSMLVEGKKRAFVASYGAKSVTNWKIISEDSNKIEWELEPITGRRHQLRVELSRRGFPIWGDSLYGSQVSGPASEIALKAVSLTIEGYEEIKYDWNWNLWKQR